jgi:hypothetical protein
MNILFNNTHVEGNWSAAVHHFVMFASNTQSEATLSIDGIFIRRLSGQREGSYLAYGNAPEKSEIWNFATDQILVACGQLSSSFEEKLASFTRLPSFRCILMRFPSKIRNGVAIASATVALWKDDQDELRAFGQGLMPRNRIIAAIAPTKRNLRPQSSMLNVG